METRPWLDPDVRGVVVRSRIAELQAAAEQDRLLHAQDRPSAVSRVRAGVGGWLVRVGTWLAQDGDDGVAQDPGMAAGS